MVTVKYKVAYGCGHEYYSNTPSIAKPCPKCGYPTCTLTVYDREAPKDAEILTPTILRFHAPISRMGNRYIINIPKALYPQIASHLNKLITITLED